MLHFTSHWDMCLERTKQWKKLSLPLHGKSHSVLGATEGKTCYPGMKGTAKQEWVISCYCTIPYFDLLLQTAHNHTDKPMEGIAMLSNESPGEHLAPWPKVSHPPQGCVGSGSWLCCKCPPCLFPHSQQHSSFLNGNLQAGERYSSNLSIHAHPTNSVGHIIDLFLNCLRSLLPPTPNHSFSLHASVV